MSASSKTPNFDFPLYEPQDTFAPLTSFNLLSSKADQQLALVKSSADTAEALSSANEQDIQALETWKAGLMAQLTEYFADNEPKFIPLNKGTPGVMYGFQRCIQINEKIFTLEFNLRLEGANLSWTKITDETYQAVLITTPYNFLNIPTVPANRIAIGDAFLISYDVTQKLTIPALTTIGIHRFNNITNVTLECGIDYKNRIESTPTYINFGNTFINGNYSAPTN